jgi:hypothetical protein
VSRPNKRRRDGKKGFGPSDVNSMKKPPGVKPPRMPIASPTCYPGR